MARRRKRKGLAYLFGKAIGKLFSSSKKKRKSKQNSSQKRITAPPTPAPLPYEAPLFYSVTQRAKSVKQPYGGYLSLRNFDVIHQPKQEDLYEKENIHASLIGAAVDYLTRFELGGSTRETFDIPYRGAKILATTRKGVARTFNSLIAAIAPGLSDATIIAACKLAGYDCCLRVGVDSYRPVEQINPDPNTIHNVRVMVARSISFFENYGPAVLRGFNLEGGYTDMVASGDGDFLTEDTLWDFKVSVRPPTSKHTLQILMYWRMGLHSIHPEFEKIQYIGFFNPRLNAVYRIPISNIADETIQAVEHDVIGY